MFDDIYRTGFTVTAIVDGVLALFCYGSYAGYDDSGMVLLAATGALTGIALWLLFMNDYLGPKR